MKATDWETRRQRMWEITEITLRDHEEKNFEQDLQHCKIYTHNDTGAFKDEVDALQGKNWNRREHCRKNWNRSEDCSLSVKLGIQEFNIEMETGVEDSHEHNTEDEEATGDPNDTFFRKKDYEKKNRIKRVQKLEEMNKFNADCRILLEEDFLREKATERQGIHLDFHTAFFPLGIEVGDTYTMICDKRFLSADKDLEICKYANNIKVKVTFKRVEPTRRRLAELSSERDLPIDRLLRKIYPEEPMN